MKINIVSRKLIKPFTPTPQNLKNYKISLKDELNWSINVSIVIFYKDSKPKLIISQLEESLSKILPQFYPLAGRYIKKGYCVDCSDQGAEFVEALAPDDVVLTDVLNTGKLEGFLPRGLDRVDGVSDPMLSVQITELIKCGGLAIGVSVSHKINDASSIGTFIAAWSNANINPKGEIVIVPSFDSPLLFPGRNLSYHAQHKPSEDTIVAKRFQFKKEAIMSLRSKLTPSGDINNNGNYALSKVRVVCAVVAEALIRVDRTKHRRSRHCLFFQAVNMRHRTIPPLPNHSCGNLAMNSVTRCMNIVANALGAQEIAIILGQAIEETISNCAEILSLGEDGQSSIIIKPEVDLIEKSSCEVNDVSFTDWSKFGFYEADFGWGKAALVGVPALFEKLIVLMNNEDGDGIEAWVHLSTNDMPCFEEDEEIKLYTTN